MFTLFRAHLLKHARAAPHSYIYFKAFSVLLHPFPPAEPEKKKITKSSCTFFYPQHPRNHSAVKKNSKSPSMYHLKRDTNLLLKERPPASFPLPLSARQQYIKSNATRNRRITTWAGARAAIDLMTPIVRSLAQPSVTITIFPQARVSVYISCYVMAVICNGRNRVKPARASLITAGARGDGAER